ncbi:LIC_13387 family protein [Occallatibacter riparius]|uniref:Uncharacterized protein n=1 Tax=Occallatibacter riparius TaxID=1002689 RepID=A0A9J7BL59_9BACT|nr:hypothetical protein [Occallatibacter riparius]UWZ83355.1 hypothetical protein MOP44_22655 [Occallatibacter riparius]
MRAAIFLRTAAVLVGIQSVLHTVGGVFGKPLPGAAETAYAAMKSNHFLVMGQDRSYWMFFIGFGLCMTVSMVMEAVVFWLLASAVAQQGVRLRPIVAVFTVGYTALTILAGMFFFPIPTVWDVLVVGCLFAATVSLKPVRMAAEVRA